MYEKIFVSERHVIVTQDGDSALMMAAKNGHTDIVVVLVKAGAKLDLQNKVRSYI